MAVDIVALALSFIEQYGLIAIFILLVLDGALLLPVFPGEIVLIMAVAVYATDINGLLMLIALTSAAGLLGALLLYSITRGGGRRLVERYPGFFMMPRKRRERLERAFQRPIGQSLVLFLRLFPLTRVLVSIPAGLARMKFVRFVVLSSMGLVLYHAGFLWFAYEARRPESTIATQATQLKDAYANPAWNFVEANTIIAGAAILLLGAILSVRASRAMLKDHEESTGSLLGLAATLSLFWGGIALAIATYMDPETVYGLVRLGGVNIHSVAARLGFGPVQVLFVVAALSVVLGYTIALYRRAAKVQRKEALAVQKALEREKGMHPRGIVGYEDRITAGPPTSRQPPQGGPERPVEFSRSDSEIRDSGLSPP